MIDFSAGSIISMECVGVPKRNQARELKFHFGQSETQQIVDRSIVAVPLIISISTRWQRLINAESNQYFFFHKATIAYRARAHTHTHTLTS